MNNIFKIIERKQKLTIIYKNYTDGIFSKVKLIQDTME